MAGVRQFDENSVFAVALDTFWSRGPAATTMPDLARATGVQRGSLYNAYGDRETIFLKAFDVYEERFLAAVGASLEGDDGRLILKRLFETAVANMTSGSPPRGCFTTKTAVDGTTASPAVHKRLLAFMDALLAAITAALSRPGVRENLRLEPVAAANVIVTFLRGMAVMERIHGDRVALLESADHLAQMLFVSSGVER